MISARMERGVVQHVEIHAQAGGICRIAGSTIPAAGGVECREDGQNIASALEGERYLRFHTDPGKHYVVLFQRHPA